MNNILKILGIIDLLLFAYMSYKVISAFDYIASALPTILAYL